MCWTSKTIPVRRIAKNNIKVYKILYKVGNIIKSPVFNEFAWEIGVDFSISSTRLYTVKSGELYYIDEGFHSLKDVPIKKGFYWYTPKTNYMLFGIDEHTDTLFECIIPKGSAYYINSNGEIVSDHLKIVKKYKKKTFKWKSCLNIFK